jgi:hypothetical protein
MTDIRPTADIRLLGKMLGPEGKPLSRNTIKRRMAKDPDFPRPFHDGYRLQWFVDEAVAYKESRPRRQYVFEAAAAP